MPLQAKVITVSDGVVAGVREDKSGDALEARLREAGFDVVERGIIADGTETVAMRCARRLAASPGSSSRPEAPASDRVTSRRKAPVACWSGRRQAWPRRCVW